MSVSVAAQLLSASVAHTLDVLRFDLVFDIFAGCKPTSYFLMEIDEIFPLLNSRNPFASGNKAPISSHHLPIFLEKWQTIPKYIFALIK